jgi:hypothetical protein
MQQIGIRQHSVGAASFNNKIPNQRSLAKTPTQFWMGSTSYIGSA